MKFWKNLLDSLYNIKYWIIEAGAQLLEPLKSIDEKLTKKQSFFANDEPIKKITNIPLLLLSKNEERKNLIIQNIGIEPCYIKLDNDISIDHFHCILAGDTFSNQGNGGSIKLENWHGEVYAICEKETRLSVLEY